MIKKILFLLCMVLLSKDLWAAGLTKPKPPAQGVVFVKPAPIKSAPEKVALPVPALNEYKYEVNVAPLAILANWYTIDILKFDPSREDIQFGYGVTGVSFFRNNNDGDDTFPNRSGFAGGLTAIWDHKDFYYATHAYYEKFERFQHTGAQVQEREGVRVNFVVGIKEIFKQRYALKFGYGLELQSYKVREYSETNRFVQTNYHTNILNPFFLEMKLSCYF